jgi:hypothetical protein
MPDLHDPQTLYRHWENEQWNPWSIDLTTDTAQWRDALTDRDKRLVYWALSSLMVAEERITTKFAGLVMAANTEEEASYLASQQVDEARHMQFYARVQDEVIDQPATIAAHIARSRDQLGESFSVIFDQSLVSAHDRLAANPQDPIAKINFITTYHLVIESVLGLTAFEFISRYLADNGSSRASSMATAASTTTSSVTSATASGTSVKPPTANRNSPRRSAAPSATCSRLLPPPSRHPTAKAPTGKRSGPAAPRSATTPSMDSRADSSSSAYQSTRSDKTRRGTPRCGEKLGVRRPEAAAPGC